MPLQPPSGDVAKIQAHMGQHVTYPATKKDLVTACNNLSEFSDADKKWFEATLPDRTYQNADEVKRAFEWR